MEYDKLLEEYIKLFNKETTSSHDGTLIKGNIGTEQWKTDFDTRKLLAVQCITDALKNGLPSHIAHNHFLEEYVPFSDAVGSQFVGRATVSFDMVIKAGREEIKNQVVFMEKCNEILGVNIYPVIVGQKETLGVYACIMEFLGNYVSLHQLIFKRNGSNEQVKNGINRALNILEKMYVKTKIDGESIHPSKLYKSRFINCLNEGNKRFTKVFYEEKWKEIFPASFESLKETAFIFEGKEISSFNTCYQLLLTKFNEFAGEFKVLIHGDAHPGNFMLCQDDSINDKLIDPNPNYGLSDYIYDLGKLLHWIETMGYFVLERAEKTKYTNISILKEYDKIKVELSFSGRNDELKRAQEIAYKHFIENVGTFCERLGDYNFQRRLDLATASAYMSGIRFFETPEAYLGSFIKAISYFNKAVFNNH